MNESDGDSCDLYEYEEGRVARECEGGRTVAQDEG